MFQLHLEWRFKIINFAIFWALQFELWIHEKFGSLYNINIRIKKFISLQTSYLIFLLLYTFIVCSRFEIKIHPAEYVLHGWVITLIFEEFRQLLYQEPANFFKKIEFYFADPWNLVDFISLLAFVVAAAFRYVAYFQNNQNYLIAARIIFATDIALFFFRLLQIFLVNRKMGPKIVMIREMVKKFFIWIFPMISFDLVNDSISSSKEICKLNFSTRDVEFIDNG